LALLRCILGSSVVAVDGSAVTFEVPAIRDEPGVGSRAAFDVETPACRHLGFRLLFGKDHQSVDRGELTVTQQPPLKNREEQLDLVEPGGMGWGVVQENMGVLVEEALDLVSEVRREVVHDAVELHPRRRLDHEVSEKLYEVIAARRVGDPDEERSRYQVRQQRMVAPASRA